MGCRNFIQLFTPRNILENVTKASLEMFFLEHMVWKIILIIGHELDAISCSLLFTISNLEEVLVRYIFPFVHSNVFDLSIEKDFFQHHKAFLRVIATEA